eukprot:7490283-Pyramimonas_sp.AAC.1
MAAAFERQLADSSDSSDSSGDEKEVRIPGQGGGSSSRGVTAISKIEMETPLGPAGTPSGVPKTPPETTKLRPP